MTLLETLLSYREMGLPVFPMNVFYDEKEKKNQKRPVVEWRKYQNELPTIEEITEWSKKYTAWGMATGEKSRIIVVDVDTDKISDVEAVLGVDLKSAMAVKTPSGGMHFYYKWEEELRNTVRIDDSPVDFRGDGGLVVIPPSSGKWGEYTWVSPISEMSKAMLPDLPKSIKGLLTINKTKVKVDVQTSGGDVFRDGERNAASVVAIRKLLGEIPQDKWMSTGWLAFQGWCKNKCEPALDDRQIKATFDWWVRANYQGKQSLAFRGTQEIGIERTEERAVEATAPTTGYDMLDHFIKGWIPGHLYVLTGETNAGKTACACNFAHRVQQQGKKVTYFALEPDIGIVEYIAGIHHKKRWADISDTDLRSLDLPGFSIFTKDMKTTLDVLLSTIEQMERQDFIVIDHIGYFTSNPKDHRPKTEQESDALKRIIGVAKKKKTAIMIIAHPRKPSTKTNKKNNPLTMNEISGSAAFKQDATDVIILHMDKSDISEGNRFGLQNEPTGTLLLPKIKTGKVGEVAIYFIPESPVMVEKNEQGNIQASIF